MKAIGCEIVKLGCAGQTALAVVIGTISLPVSTLFVDQSPSVRSIHTHKPQRRASHTWLPLTVLKDALCKKMPSGVPWTKLLRTVTRCERSSR